MRKEEKSKFMMSWLTDALLVIIILELGLVYSNVKNQCEESLGPPRAAV